MSTRVKSIMIRDVKTVNVDETVLAAAEIMNRHEIGSIIVVENGNPAGIVTERDLLKRVVAKRKDPATTRISAVMSKPLATVKSNTTIARALNKMVKNNVKKLVVTRTDRLVGILSLTDLIPILDGHISEKKIPLKKIPKHMKRAFEIYYDPIRQIRKKCPLTIGSGASISCIGPRCMWYVGERCVFLSLATRA